MIFYTILDKDIDKIYQVLDSSLWSVHSVQPHVSKKIQNQSKKFKYLYIYAILAVQVVGGVAHLSIWGSHSELQLSVLAFKAFFGSWSRIIEHFYFCTFLYLAYVILRLPLLLLYVFLQLEIQFILLNRHILCISSNHNEEHVHNEVAQRDIKRKTIFCVKQHLVLKKSVI